jgi:hypothetical protein
MSTPMFVFTTYLSLADVGHLTFDVGLDGPSRCALVEIELLALL